MSDRDNQQQTNITWHLIADGRADVMPDVDIRVMVYDEGLEDSVSATLDDSSGQPQWIDDMTGDALPAPLWWAEWPFPEV